MRLDHVALATRDVAEPLATLVGGLGATVLSGGHSVGFRPMQVFLGDGTGGMKVELLEPWEAERNDFLERFLTRHGDGPHHLTFKVDDLEATLDRLAAAGITPVRVDLSRPEWREAFLLPRDAQGTVVQLAHTTFELGLPLDEYRAAHERGPMGEPRWWPEPPPRNAVAATLRRVVLRARDLDRARRLFVDLLGGAPVAPGDDERLELQWPGGARLLLEHSPTVMPGIDRLELAGGAAQVLTVAGARFDVRA
jgi:catechol 2,3-dioxygenase-like lactoylglutathione lyase family enzyme